MKCSFDQATTSSLILANGRTNDFHPSIFPNWYAGQRLAPTSRDRRHIERLPDLGILSLVVGALAITLTVCAGNRLRSKTGSSNVATQLILHRHQLLSITRRDLNVRQKTPEEIEAMALEKPSSAPVVSEQRLFGVDDRDRFYLNILRVRQFDRRKYCLLTHHDRIADMTLSMRFPRKRKEAGVISFKISLEGVNRYQGETILR
ncbi:MULTISPECIES: hypothetical protein [Pacificibacter]|uniref:hypothetical protein n=1 Tax=Pacificibacter TaxID=1042323 RepID=UPI001C096F97|nr:MULTISPECIES: hypothetical protein [Pacificibacter]MBU2936491.1 hypothetical protein [Pacificibacter marinus]MDO6614707.1 hypothetical protein [Pacificibacter sp. 1_MG-2023]